METIMHSQHFSFSKDCIQVSVTAPSWAHRVEVCFFSERNCPVSRMTDISETHPNRQEAIKNLGETTGDLLFPFVDLYPEKNSLLRLSFENPKGVCCADPFRCKTECALLPIVEVAADALTAWENNFFISCREVQCVGCAQVFFGAPVAGNVQFMVRSLAANWSGKAEIWCYGEQRKEMLAQQTISLCDNAVAFAAPDDTQQPDTLRQAVCDAVDFLFRCRDTGDGICNGGMHLFYDLEKTAYRGSHWNWTYGPAIGALLGCLHRSDLVMHYSGAQLLEYATGLADVVLRFENRQEGHPCQGVSLGRWQQNLQYRHGIMGYYSIADSGFCAKWGIMPLYEHTQQEQYLQATQRLLQAAKRWLAYDAVLPADYLDDLQEFSDRSIDETMFAMGLFQSLFAATHDEAVRTLGLNYFTTLCEKLKMNDGKWARTYLKTTGKNLGFENDTKGHGWAMDGLLCAAQMGGEEGTYYLSLACETADLLLAHQYEDGHWDNFFGREAIAGAGEKSTALWSWLLYRLYEQSGETKYRIGAKKALQWCMNHMYSGNDPLAKGSIVAHSVQSGIIYREVVPMACTDTTSFFVLAALKELELE